ncbi:hypothetical protein, partial [Enterococcus malodoratus]|uniref:hypothetical protein n=1 Tax=Enterococcus malodoratus TaxID=71451 RepID=UPI0020747F1C
QYHETSNKLFDDLNNTQVKLNEIFNAIEENKVLLKSEADIFFAKKTDLTKENIGLGNVDNFTTATQAEAETGESNSVFMTPALVFKAIAKWVQGKFVSSTGNETVLGVKNFQDGVQIKGNLPVLTKSVNDYASVDKNNNASVISNGSMKLSRRGDIVYLTGSFQLSAAKNNQAVWFDVPSWAAPIDMSRMYWKSGVNFYLLTFDPSTLNNIICAENVAKDAWLTGSSCWLARDPY